MSQLLVKFSYLLVLLLLSSCFSRGERNQLIHAVVGDGQVRVEHEDKGQQYMVVSQGPYTTMAAEQMFERGGNIFDAATAATFTISVERPHSTGIGGGGFAVYRHQPSEGDAYTQTLDFREKAPLSAHSQMFLDDQGEALEELSRHGALSVGVPGLVKGILELHQRYGQLPLQEVMRPAILLARNGFPVYPELDFALSHSEERLADFQSTTDIFFRDGKPLELGDILVQRDLAATLEIIASKGVNGFYQGTVAQKIVSAVQNHGGIIELKDLEQYHTVWREPIRGSYRGYQVYSMPPPSSGGAHIIQILNTIEGDPLQKWGPYHPHTVHLVSSAMQQAFADRAQFMGDTDFVDVPLEFLTSKEYATQVRSSIDLKSAKSADQVRHADISESSEMDHTIHFTIADNKGNVFSSTQTINGFFGSGLVAAGTGIVLNNEMDDFAAKAGAMNIFGAVGGDKNLVEAGKRPLSSMSPTIVVKEGSPVLALGSPSGTRILTCVASTIMNYLDFEMNLYDAVNVIRYHHQWLPDYIRVDRPGFSDRLTRSLEQKGHRVVVEDLGCRIQAIAFYDGILHGVSDMRGQGKSSGR